MPYFIRPMRKEDVSQVNEIDREAFPGQWPPPNYKHELQNQIARYIIAGEEGRAIKPLLKAERVNLLTRLLPWLKGTRNAGVSAPEQPYIIGFAGIWILADEAHITNIAVRTTLQCHGIGELLLIHVIDLAAKLKVANMTLEVRASNKIAQSLYQKYGFVEMGVRRGYYLDNREDAVIMSTENIHTDSYQALLEQREQAYLRKWGNQPLPASGPLVLPDRK